MENRSAAQLNIDDNESLNQETPVVVNRLTVLSTSEQLGGVIQPINPHFAGFNVVVDIENEDPDVQWLPNPGFVAIVIAEEEATPLSMTEIQAINIAPERTSSTDDERPASSYPLLDRRRYREDTIPSVYQPGVTPLAIGSRLDVDEDDVITTVAVIPTLGQVETTSATQTSTSSGVSPQEDDHFNMPRRRGKRKRKH